MPKKKADAKDRAPAKPKRLRKQLHTAEADLKKAEAKRDKAQARVEALSIIADEIRAQVVEADKATAGPVGDPRGKADEATTTSTRAKAATPAKTAKPATRRARSTPASTARASSPKTATGSGPRQRSPVKTPPGSDA